LDFQRLHFAIPTSIELCGMFAESAVLRSVDVAMAYLEDLSVNRSIRENEPNALNVGWLSKGRPFEVRETSEAFRAALRKICDDNPILLCCGHHVCEFCSGASWGDPYFSDMGNGEIWVRDAGGTWYAAPRLIVHYVEEHGYCPPQGFIDAVLNPSEIGRDEFSFPVEADEAERIRDEVRRLRELRGPPTSDVVRHGIRNTPPKKSWWKFWME
jgi:hypothetical protein